MVVAGRLLTGQADSVVIELQVDVVESGRFTPHVLTDALKDVSMADVITDYKASEGDTLDVSKLLDSLLGHQASEAEALASVKTTVSGADTVVSVNANGGWHDVAVLQNTTEAVKILFDDKHDTTTAPHVGATPTSSTPARSTTSSSSSPTSWPSSTGRCS